MAISGSGCGCFLALLYYFALLCHMVSGSRIRGRPVNSIPKCLLKLILPNFFSMANNSTSGKSRGVCLHILNQRQAGGVALNRSPFGNFFV